MDINLNTTVSNSNTLNGGVNAELTDKTFTNSLSNNESVSDVRDTDSATDVKGTVNERIAIDQKLKQEAKEDDENSSIISDEELLEALNNQNLGLTFKIDKDLERTLINVMNKDTDEMVRQIPSEEFMRIVKSMRNYQEVISSQDIKDTKINESAKELKGVILDDIA